MGLFVKPVFLIKIIFVVAAKLVMIKEKGISKRHDARLKYVASIKALLLVVIVPSIYHVN